MAQVSDGGFCQIGLQIVFLNDRSICLLPVTISLTTTIKKGETHSSTFLVFSKVLTQGCYYVVLGSVGVGGGMRVRL